MHFKQYNHFLSDTTFLFICTGLPECNDFNLSFKKEKKCWSEWNWGNESKAKVIHSISISITGLHLPIQTFIIAVTISLFIKQAYTVCIYLWGLHYHHLYTCIHTHAHTHTERICSPFSLPDRCHPSRRLSARSICWMSATVLKDICDINAWAWSALGPDSTGSLSSSRWYHAH